MRSWFLLIALVTGCLQENGAWSESSTVVVPKEIQGPIVPTRALIPQTKKTEQTVEELNLPYKPGEFVIGDDVFTGNGSTIEGGDILPIDQATPENAAPKKDDIDWSKVPFVPSKSPDLKPAADPE